MCIILGSIRDARRELQVKCKARCSKPDSDLGEISVITPRFSFKSRLARPAHKPRDFALRNRQDLGHCAALYPIHFNLPPPICWQAEIVSGIASVNHTNMADREARVTLRTRKFIRNQLLSRRQMVVYVTFLANSATTLGPE
jgi:hypothetical protein